MDDLGHDTVPFKTTPADDEKHPRKQCSRDEVQDDQDGSRHCPDDGKAHEEVRHALLDYAFGDDLLLPNLTAVIRLDDFEYAVEIG